MKVLKRIISIVIVTVMLLTVVSYAAVVTDNDASSFVTKAEFEAVKNNVQGQIDSYNNNLDNAIDGSIATYLSTVDIGGTSSAMVEKIKKMLIEPGNADWGTTAVTNGAYTKYLLDAIYPVGSYALGTKPNIGTWVEITGDKALWIKNTAADGTTISQALPKPTMDTVNTSEIDNHTHGVGDYTVSGNITPYSIPAADTCSVDGAFGNSSTVSKKCWQYGSADGRALTKINLNAYSGHGFSGTSAAAGKHKHTVTPTVKTAGAYGDGTKVQPDAYVVKVWKRTA